MNQDSGKGNVCTGVSVRLANQDVMFVEILMMYKTFLKITILQKKYIYITGFYFDC